MRGSLGVAWIACAMGVAGCVETFGFPEGDLSSDAAPVRDGEPAPDGGDASSELGPGADTGVDADEDTSADAASDADADASLDAPVDVATDMGGDAGTEAALDARADSAADAAVDAALDAGADVVDDAPLVCAPGTGDCDGKPANGCEATLDTDEYNCGVCGNTCSLPSAAAVCFNGACAIGQCAFGYADCDGDPKNGCEVDTQSDVAHCGTCPDACPTYAGGARTCSGGACGVVCNAGRGNCDGDVVNGCETDTTTSVANCGACGNACSVAHATPSCSSGACSLACASGWGNCDGDASNGCETDTTTSVASCGACGTACSNANGSTGCDAGSCAPVCNGGYGDCDGDATNGCETDTTATTSHCGACTVACVNANGTTSCSGGSCAPVCTSGWGDCDGDKVNGCETGTTANDANCGACGTACTNVNGTTACSASKCTPACNSGWADCDGNQNNGCETDTSTSNGNCGACGTSCASGRICSGGACVAPPSCAIAGAGLTDCGDGGGGTESCCVSSTVTGGTFYRSYDGISSRYTGQAYPATVSSFRLDKYETTVGRFRKFVNAVVGGWTPPAGSGKHAHLNSGRGLSDGKGTFEGGWDPAWTSYLSTVKGTWDYNLSCNSNSQTWTSAAGPNEKLPINCATWWEQYAFCIWDDAFLPTEAEWNYAAAGGPDQRVYPWSIPDPPGSTSIDCTYANYYNGSTYCSTASSSGGKTVVVGLQSPKGNGRWGQADLAGNVSEWVFDYNAYFYPVPCVDCAVIATGLYRDARGGGFADAAAGVVASQRLSRPPLARDPGWGARCARTP